MTSLDDAALKAYTKDNSTSQWYAQVQQEIARRAASASTTRSEIPNRDTRALFMSLVGDKSYNQQTLLDLEPELAKYGIRLTPPNSQGERTKIFDPVTGEWTRVGFGEGKPVWIPQGNGSPASGSGYAPPPMMAPGGAPSPFAQLMPPPMASAPPGMYSAAPVAQMAPPPQMQATQAYQPTPFAQLLTVPRPQYQAPPPMPWTPYQLGRRM